MAVGVVDFHNHLMPGVDDGAQDDTQALAGLRAMQADGVAELVATPHLEGMLTGRAARLTERLEELDVAWERLQQLAASLSMAVHRGAEVALDTPEPDLSDDRVRLAGTRFVLVEFAYMTVPPNAGSVLRRIRDAGWVPVLAHPERYTRLGGASPGAAGEWRQAGALLQVNGASLLGRYGPDAKRTAQFILERGWADYLCSDFHSRTGPWIAASAAWLREHGGQEQAALLMQANPQRLLRGEDPLPVPPLPRRLWERVRSIFD